MHINKHNKKLKTNSLNKHQTNKIYKEIILKPFISLEGLNDFMVLKTCLIKYSAMRRFKSPKQSHFNHLNI